MRLSIVTSLWILSLFSCRDQHEADKVDSLSQDLLITLPAGETESVEVKDVKPSRSHSQTKLFFSSVRETRKANERRIALLLQTNDRRLKKYIVSYADEEKIISRDLEILLQQENLPHLPVLIDLKENHSYRNWTKARGSKANHLLLIQWRESLTREIQEFGEAANFDQPRIRVFAQSFLPVLEKQLHVVDSITSLK